MVDKIYIIAKKLHKNEKKLANNQGDRKVIIKEQIELLQQLNALNISPQSYSDSMQFKELEKILFDKFEKKVQELRDK